MQLSSTSTDLSQLQTEHQTLETRLQELARRKSYSPEERYELQVIKKRKLAIKDMIQRLS